MVLAVHAAASSDVCRRASDFLAQQSVNDRSLSAMGNKVIATGLEGAKVSKEARTKGVGGPSVRAFGGFSSGLDVLESLDKAMV